MGTEENIQEEIQIFPLSKGKRFVAFAADFALVFVIAFALFHLAFYPLCSYASNLYGEQEQCLKTQKERDLVLYGNKLLFYEEGKSDREPSSYSANLVYTCSVYVSSLLGKSSSEGDVLRTYFVDLRKDEGRYLDFIKTKDAATRFFDYSPLALKPQYAEEFAPFYEVGNAPSKKGEEDYQRFQKEFFLPSYGAMIQEIGKEDLTYEGISYVEKQSEVASFNAKSNGIVLLSAGLAETVSLSIVFLVVPLLSKTRKTLGMLFLRRERVRVDGLTLVRKRTLPLHFLYALFANAGLLFLLPWPIVSFNELFAIPSLWQLSLLSLLFDLVSLFFLLFDKMDRTLVDKLTGTVMLEEEMMDALYRAKGYGE